MNIKFQRLVDRLIGIPLCIIFSLTHFIRRKSNVQVIPRKILVILLSEMGSLILAYPMFNRLKQKYPGASIHVLLFGKNREVLDLLNVIPKDNILTINDHSPLQFIMSSLKNIKKIRNIKFDVVIDCELFSRISSIFSYLSGANLHVGFHRHTQEGLYRGSFINRPVTYNPYRHLTQQFLTMAEAVEANSSPKNKFFSETDADQSLLLEFDKNELTHFFEKLYVDFPSIKQKKLILIYPSGGILPLRAWPLDYYCQLAKNLLNDGYAIAVIGLQSDNSLGQTIQSKMKSPYCINLTGYTKSVRELLLLFNRASLLITNDGAPGQFAALTPVPTIIFFGPETPNLYKSLSKNAYYFFLHLPCSPCLTAYNHRISPCDGDNQCLKQIMPNQVLKKAREMLHAYSKEQEHNVDLTIC